MEPASQTISLISFVINLNSNRVQVWLDTSRAASFTWPYRGKKGRAAPGISSCTAGPRPSFPQHPPPSASFHGRQESLRLDLAAAAPCGPCLNPACEAPGRECPSLPRLQVPRRVPVGRAPARPCRRRTCGSLRSSPGCRTPGSRALAAPLLEVAGTQKRLPSMQDGERRLHLPSAASSLSEDPLLLHKEKRRALRVLVPEQPGSCKNNGTDRCRSLPAASPAATLHPGTSMYKSQALLVSRVLAQF